MSYNNWTEQQKQAAKTWIVGQGTQDTVELRKRIMQKPITGYNDWDETIDRDKLLVQTEALLKTIAQSYGITTSTTPAQVNQIFLDAFQMAGTTAGRFQVMDDKHMFWICYVKLTTVDVSGDSTQMILHHDPIYGQSPAEEMGLGDVNGDDIEIGVRYPQ